MFVPTTLKKAPGLDAELCVWNAITKTVDPNETIAFHHYPMFFENSSGRREIDILIVNQDLGVCVIEVKGITINQINSINGHEWSYTNFYEDKGGPYQQAESQLHMLCKHLEKNPLLYGRLCKRAFVALPNITQEQWRQKGFHELIHTPLPLFKEDLEDKSRLIKKMQTFKLSKVKEPLSDFDMEKIKQHLGIQETKHQQITLQKQLPFSRLYIVQSSGDFQGYKEEIMKALKSGTKIYLLSYTDLDVSQHIEHYSKHVESFQLNLYKGKAGGVSNRISTGCYVDGEDVSEELLDQLGLHFPAFNKGQFKAIHQPVDNHQIITAGAGTGKTHVMIDRILFLLMNGGVPLKLITMITFTNASTNEMKKRLEEKFILLFKLTKRAQFLSFAEEVKDMQISTIHSFASSILKQLAHEIGYGQNVGLRSFKFNKTLLIQELLDEFFSSRPADQFLKTKIEDYDFINLVYDMWEEMEKKGLSAEEIKNIDWGTVGQKEEQIIQALLKYIFSHCEDRIDEIKRAENAITMGDLIRKLKSFTSDPEKMKQLSSGHFIFVDEFQDSDAVQIELLASLQKFLQYRLFVVGDIKQAIYRFRGADYKSFRELQDVTHGVRYTETELQINYRSSSSILEKMHPLFEKWDKKGWLTYKQTDRLISNKVSDCPNDDWHVSSKYEEDFKKALKSLPTKKDKIAFIVRTNGHAKKIKDYCVLNNIPTSENLDGTFFISPTVLHFKALLDGLLYSHEPKFLVNALETPYFGLNIPYQVLLPFGGNKERMVSFINSRTDNDLPNYALLLRTLAPMTVIQKIIQDKQLFARLPKYMEMHLSQQKDGEEPVKEDVELAVLRYEKNLQHLMILIERQFSTKHVTLQGLRDWLQLQISTNRTENEPILEQNKAQVEITTVHRSKGLEYHTVFLPITYSPFNAVEQKYFLEEASEENKKGLKRKFGWKVKVKKGSKVTREYQNSYFDSLKVYEDQEQLKEETRLLYVALTRAKQRVYITMPKPHQIKNECWALILKEGGIFEKGEGSR
ncbi:UvrD-helicase domain-containing protein [Priestia koreensis]|uniref:DNA 3'-5' helicase n=1 Tax=Priestia koreensis TaxID=284581 RepID=A0A0M0KW94_9BACI|nr:UvrD-helicase domain-containing protein [Priestia koreensis]KOO43084.1 hypothetical protein AMD01_16175 [Priestia koreensis]